MGWARTLLLGDVGNRLDIADVEYDAGDLRQQLRRSRALNDSHNEAIQQLQKENEQLEMCVAAMAKTLVAKGIFTPEELERLVRIIED